VEDESFSKRRTNEEGYKEPTEQMKLSKPEKIMDFIEKWPEHLALYNSQKGGPLSYVIRRKVEPPDEVEDTLFGKAGSCYSSPRDEVEERASHGTQEYQVDNAKVSEMLNEVVSDHKNIKTWMKAHAKAKNGRAAGETFKERLCGMSQMEAIEATAEKQLASLVYRGEKPRYNFETHVSKHLRAHLDIEKAGGEMREQSNVRKLLDSVQVSFLNAAVATSCAKMDC
jgi:hypothetical protein